MCWFLILSGKPVASKSNVHPILKIGSRVKEESIQVHTAAQQRAGLEKSQSRTSSSVALMGSLPFSSDLSV